MSNINEEEVLNIVYDIVIYRGTNDGLSDKEYDALYCLLDLYKHEKQKNEINEKK